MDVLDCWLVFHAVKSIVKRVQGLKLVQDRPDDFRTFAILLSNCDGASPVNSLIFRPPPKKKREGEEEDPSVDNQWLS